jgi:F0F1-type ATP synthase alpha subunit
MTEEEIKKFIDKKTNEFFRNLTNSDDWIEIKKMFEENTEEALNDLKKANEITSENAESFLSSVKKHAASILTFAGLNGFLSDAVMKNAENFKEIFRSLTNTDANNNLILLTGYIAEGLNRETQK